LGQFLGKNALILLVDHLSQQPTGNDYLPFYLGDGQLTIRAYVTEEGDLYGGLLCSMDGQGRGFAQQYGVFFSFFLFSFLIV